MTRTFLLTLTILFCTQTLAGADEIRLANGDRITGRVGSLSGGTLTVSTPHGDLRIPWTNITGLTIDEPILATLGTSPPARVTIAASSENGRVTLQPGGTVSLIDIAALTRPQPPLVVNGGASAGFVSSAGNTDVNNLRLDGDVVARAGANRLRVPQQ